MRVVLCADVSWIFPVKNCFSTSCSAGVGMCWAKCKMRKGTLMPKRIVLSVWSAPPCSHLCFSLSPGEEMAVWQCLTLLEEGLSHSPSNAQFKLLLIRIYCRLGAFEPVAELYSSLDAKHIQHDTIGWVVYTENNWLWWPSGNCFWDLQLSLLLKDSRLSDFHCVLEICKVHLLKCALLLVEYLSCVILIISGL